MRFGATLADGGAMFRLWAPAVHSVELVFQEGAGRPEHQRPLGRGAGGWHQVSVPEARPGWRYRYRLDGKLLVPDPASRFNPEDVHGPSELVDPEAFEWDDAEWKGRPWNEAVIYELHVGTFSPEGTFGGVESRLEHLAALGVTAIEMMPLADFPGRWGWGYDGVLQYAPDASYGRPEDLKRLVQAAHRRGLMVFIDVVYNHFGPEGNYLHACAPEFFTDRHHTPWGQAINFDGPGSPEVRSFFIHNALYWIEEFHCDGLRLDAVHALRDDSKPEFLCDLAQAIHERPGRERHIHLVLENDLNDALRLERDASGAPRQYTAQWNDDFHHAAHALVTSERDGYYADYPRDGGASLARCLAQGFAYQGEKSAFRGRSRGAPSAHLPPLAFVNFLQNHDQVGNRAFGERLGRLADPPAVAAITALLLLAPSPPLIFMGQEFDAPTPFLFFADFSSELAEATRQGRLREFSGFSYFRDPQAMQRIPDPLSSDTFQRSKIPWNALTEPRHAAALAQCQLLLELRRREIVPLVPRIVPGSARYSRRGVHAWVINWRLKPGIHEDVDDVLHLLANLGDAPQRVDPIPPGRVLYGDPGNGNELARWSVRCVLQTGVTA